MADLVSEMLGKFAELAQEEKNINADIDKALKEYNDYCKSFDDDLNRKLEEIRGKIRKVSELMQYAREHASDLEEARMPFETPEGQLESIRQTIKLDSRNDPNAESLYTKASGQKLFYEAEMERTRKLIEGSKVQAKRQYDKDVAALESRREQHEQELRAYVMSEDFKRYLQLLSFDKSAFNSHSTVNLIDKSKISIGQRRIRFSVPMEVEQELSAISNGEYNPASRTIGAPFRVPTQKGSVLMLEYDERNQTYLMGGVERLLLNLLKYCGGDITDMVYLDPSENSVDALGIMSAFAKGINPFIIAPQSPVEINSKMSEIYSVIKSNPTPSFVSRVIVIHGFPEAFGAEFCDQVMDLARDIEHSGVMLILIHNGASEETDTVSELRSIGITIRSRNGSFYIDKTRESLFWYSKPSDIPDAVRRLYIEQRRVAGAQPAQPKPVQPAYTPPPVVTPAAPAPAVEAAATQQVVTQQTVPQQAVPQQVATQSETVKEDQSPVSEQPQNVESAEQFEKNGQAEDIIEAEKAETVEAVEDFEEVTAEKGSRRLPRVKIGAREYLDISGSAAYICGKNSEDRTRLVKAVINCVQVYTHPDSAELWLFDNDRSLIDLVKSDCAHLKYAVSDEADETAVDLIELLVCEKKSRAALFKEKHYASYDDVPSDVYLPRIIAVISDFTELLKALDRAPLYFGKDPRYSLEGLLKNSAKYGINLVLIGKTFSEDGEAPYGLDSLIESAAAVSGRDRALDCLFDCNNGNIPNRIPEGQALVSTANGAVLTKIDIPEYGEPKSYTLSYEYDGNEENYLEKRPLIADRSAAVMYSEREGSRTELIAVRENSEIMLFLGEPCRISANAPVILREDYAENLLVLAPKSSEKAASSVVAAALKSLEEQGILAEIIAAKDNSIYTELAVCGLLSGTKVVESDHAAARIKEISSQLSSGGAGMMNQLLIILGGDTLMTSIHAEDQNASAELKKLFLKGAKCGCRVMFVCSGVSQMASGFLSLFRHRVVFPCPAAEAEKLVQISDCELMNDAFRISSDSEEFSAVPYKI